MISTCMAYFAFKDQPIRAASDKVLHDKALDIVKNPKYDGYQRGNSPMIYKFFDERSVATRAYEIHKTIIRSFQKTQSLLLF